MKPGRTPVGPRPTLSPSWTGFLNFGALVVACMMAFGVAVVPDEKLIRSKLLVLEFGTFILVVLVGSRWFMAQRWPQALKWQWGLAAVFVMVQGGLWMLTTEKSLATTELRRVILVAASFVVFATLGAAARAQRVFLLSWVAGAALVCVYSLLQWTGGVGVLVVPQAQRVFGTFGNPIFLAGFLSMSIFVVVHLGRESTSVERIFLTTVGFLLVGVLLLTQTRGAWIGTAVGVVVGTAIHRPRLAWKVWAVGLMVAVVAGGLAFQSVWLRDQAHLAIWRDTFAMWLTHPWTGVGIGTFHIHFPDYAQPDLIAKWPMGQFIVNDAHSEVLQQLAEGGVIGFLSWMIIPSYFFWTLMQEPQRLKKSAWLIAAVSAIVVQNFFSVDMRFAVSAALAAQLIGLVVGVNEAPMPLQFDLRRCFAAVVWTAVLLLILPLVFRPYRAQQHVAKTPTFFNERLLEPAQTIADLEKLAVNYPSEPVVLERLAYVYSKEIRGTDGQLRIEMARKAIAAYERLRQLDPSRDSASNNLANIFFTLGQREQAIAIWNEIVQRSPSFIDARLNLGKVLFSEGKLKLAAAQFDAVLRLDPSNAEAIVYLKRMVE